MSDADQAIANGFYHTAGNSADMPGSGEYWPFLTMRRPTGDRAAQLVFAPQGVFARRMNGSIWGGWFELWSTEQTPELAAPAIRKAAKRQIDLGPNQEISPSGGEVQYGVKSSNGDVIAIYVATLQILGADGVWRTATR